MPSYLVTFTVPSELRPVMPGNRQAMELLMGCSSQALTELLADPARGCRFDRSGFFGEERNPGSRVPLYRIRPKMTRKRARDSRGDSLDSSHIPEPRSRKISRQASMDNRPERRSD